MYVSFRRFIYESNQCPIINIFRCFLSLSRRSFSLLRLMYIFIIIIIPFNLSRNQCLLARVRVRSIIDHTRACTRAIYIDVETKYQWIFSFSVYIYIYIYEYKKLRYSLYRGVSFYFWMRGASLEDFFFFPRHVDNNNNLIDLYYRSKQPFWY